MADTTHNIRIRMDTTGVKQGTQEVASSLQKAEAQAEKATAKVTLLGRAMQNLRSQALSLGGALGGFSAGFAALASVNVLAGFEDKMADVRAVTQATDADFKTLRDTALELGASTRFTATQAAEGLELLGRAGATADQSLKLINTTLQLSQAENLSLAESADTLVKVLSGMRLPLSEASRVADLLSATSSKTTTDVRELGVAFRYGATAAAGFKVPIEEVAAALGILAQNGQTGSLGGTGLRGFMSRLAAPTKDFLKELKQLGIAYDEVNPKSVGFIDILKRFRTAQIGASESFALFNQRSGSVAEILVNNIAPLETLLGQLQKVGGSLQIKTDIKADTLQADLLGALSAVQALILALGDAGLTRVIRIAAQTFAVAFRGLADTITALAPVIKNIAVGFAVAFSPFILAGFVAGLVQLTATFALLPGLILRAAAAMAAFAVANPFTAIAVAIGALITLVQKFGSTWRAVGTSFASVADVFDVVMKRISSAALGVVNFVVGAFQKMVAGIKAALQVAVDAAVSVVNKVGGFFGAGAVEGFKFAAPEGLQNFVAGIGKEADQLALLRKFRALQGEFKSARAANPAAPAEDLAKSIKSVGEEDESLRRGFSRTRDVLDQIYGPQSEALASIATLNSLFEKGQVTVSEYADQLQRMRGQLLQNDQTLTGGMLKGLNQVAEGVTKLGDNVAGVISNAFNSASNAIAEFAATGKFSFQDLANSILRDMARLASNAIFGALANNLLGAVGGGSVGGAGLLGGGGGGGLGSLFGFASGGSFKVGGQGGVDSKVVSFRATPGELVDVRTPGQARQAGGGEPIINIYNNGGGQASVQNRGKDSSGRPIIDVVISAVNEAIAGGKMDGAMKGRYAISNATVSR